MCCKIQHIYLKKTHKNLQNKKQSLFILMYLHQNFRDIR
jgi:hypothetical protein